MKHSSQSSGLLRPIIGALLAICLPSLAHAHVVAGEASGLLHGLAHPFSGLDHLCAMLAVGLWAAQMGGRATWRLPLTFVSAMAVGGLLGMADIPVPFVETGIAMSLLALGVLIAATVRFPLSVSVAIVGVFALFHGYAHIIEMPLNVSCISYAAGSVLATALLHASGTGAVLFAQHIGRTRWLRIAGTAIALLGGGIWLTA